MVRWEGWECTLLRCQGLHPAFATPIVSTTATSIEMIDFITSTILTKSSLSVTSAFRGGGVGAGVLGGIRVTHTDTTAATVLVMDTAIAVGLEWPSYKVGSLKRAIIMAPSMESWDLRLGERFGPTSATMDMQADHGYG